MGNWPIHVAQYGIFSPPPLPPLPGVDKIGVHGPGLAGPPATINVHSIQPYPSLFGLSVHLINVVLQTTIQIRYIVI